MISKKLRQTSRTTLLIGVAIVVVTIASFMLLRLGGNHQALANGRGSQTASVAISAMELSLADSKPAQNTARKPLVIGPYIDVNPAKGVKGTTVRIRGYKFGANEKVDIAFGNQVVATVTADQFGRFFVLVQVPAGVGPGTVNITSTGRTTKLVATFPFNVLPVLPPNLRPLSGRPRTRVSVYGGLFPPGDTVTANLVCQQSSCVSSFLGTYTVLSNGTIRGSFIIPSGTAPGQYSVVFSDSSGDTTSVPFTVTQ